MSKEINSNIKIWVENYTQELYSWALFKVSDSELAKDLVQDTFLAAAEKINSFKGDSSPKTWLFSILNFKIIDIYRSKAKQFSNVNSEQLSKFFDVHGEWKENVMPSDWEDEEANLLDNSDFRTVLQKCLATLPEKWNICIQSKYLMNKKGDEICQELDIAPTNLWQIVHRAKLQLRNCIEINWFKQ